MYRVQQRIFIPAIYQGGIYGAVCVVEVKFQVVVDREARAFADLDGILYTGAGAGSMNYACFPRYEWLSDGETRSFDRL